MHRDLGQHALRQPITIRIEPDRLVVSNPGGLYGITRDRLGREGVASARNGVLVRIAQFVRFQGDQRVCEALASGIPTVLRSLVATDIAERHHGEAPSCRSGQMVGDSPGEAQ